MVAVHGLTPAMSSQISALASFMFQGDAIDSGNAKTLEVFVIVAALSLLIVAITVVAVAFVAYKAQKEIMGHVNEIKAKLMPIIDKSHTLVTDLTPEIKQITTKVHEITGKVNEITGKVNDITGIVKSKAEEISPTISQANETFKGAMDKAKTTFNEANQTVGDVNQKTRVQVDRVNGMVSGALDATTRIGKAIEHGITQPGRELAGLVSGAKATADSFLKHSGDMGGQVVSKIIAMFGKSKKPGSTSTRPVPAYRANPAQAASVVPFSSMANAAGSGISGDMEPGISSGSGGNGDPIVG